MTGIPNFQSLQQPAISSLGKQPSSGKMPQPTLLFGGDLEDSLSKRKHTLEEESKRVEDEKRQAANKIAVEQALKALETEMFLPDVKPIELLKLIYEKNAPYSRRGNTPYACGNHIRLSDLVTRSTLLNFFTEQEEGQVLKTLARFEQLGLLFPDTSYRYDYGSTLHHGCGLTEVGHECLDKYNLLWAEHKPDNSPQSDGFWAMLKKMF